MATQKRLEAEAIELRKEHLVKNEFQHEVDEYSESNSKALSDGDPMGKGTGTSMSFSIPNEKASKTQMKYNVDTTAGGGQYDIEGRNGVSGRKWCKTVNLYNDENAYGVDSVDTTENRREGQYVVE